MKLGLGLAAYELRQARDPALGSWPGLLAAPLHVRPLSVLIAHYFITALPVLSIDVIIQ